jgi:type III secretion protein T
VLAVARPFGFTMFFTPFQWGQAGTGVVRMAIAVALAMPALGFDASAPAPDTLQYPFMAMLAKEVAVGALLGFTASAPLSMAIGAGGIIDYYRGAAMGDADPSGGQSTPTANLLAIASLWTFANVGGFWACASIIYSSYGVWSVIDPLPAFDPGAEAVLTVISEIIKGAVLLAAPLVFIMFISDLAHLVSAKFGKNINVTAMAFSSKALIAILVLPPFMLIAARSMRDDYDWLSTVVSIAGKVFQ